MSIEYIEVVLVPLLIGVLEALKRAGFNSKFIPLVSIGLGLGLGLVFSEGGPKQGLLVGLMIGLSAVGLYSGVKSVKLGIDQKLIP